MNNGAPLLQLSNNGIHRSSHTLAKAIVQSVGPSASFFTRESGETLFSMGEQPSKVLILLEGKVKLWMDSIEGRTIIFRVAGAEEVLELSSVISGEPYDKTANTLVSCRFASVSVSDFEALLRSKRKALILALSELNGFFKQACLHIQMLAEPSAAVRLARTILAWAAQGQRTERGLRFHTFLNHTEIGEYIGARRETVTRMLSEFQRRGIIDIRGVLLTVTDKDGLENCAGLSDVGEG